MAIHQSKPQPAAAKPQAPGQPAGPAAGRQAPGQAPGHKQAPGAPPSARPDSASAAKKQLAGMNHADGQHFVSPAGGRLGQAPGGDALLRMGSSGADVTALQNQLKARGFDPGPIDGQFGPQTKAAVVQFQKANHLGVDGVVGPQTNGTLNAAPTANAGARPEGATTGGASKPDAGAKPAAALNPHQISAGAKGADVILLQTELKKRGFDVGKIDGDFGPGTQRALKAFQKSSGLGADGIAGSATWAALGQKCIGDASDTNTPGGVTPGGEGNRSGPPQIAKKGEGGLREKILANAKGELGKLEVGNNGGAATKYQGAFARGKEPWCADFVSWVYSTSGKGMNNPYVPSIVAQLKKTGRWRTKNPKPGDMVIFDWNGDGEGDHIGIVESQLRDGSIRTIEGNTSNPNGNGQEGVFERSRSKSVILGYGDADG